MRGLLPFRPRALPDEDVLSAAYGGDVVLTGDSVVADAGVDTVVVDAIAVTVVVVAGSVVVDEDSSSFAVSPGSTAEGALSPESVEPESCVGTVTVTIS